MSAFKENLMNALHEAVQSYNKSGDPNDAVVKTALAHDFNIDQATRLLETFNTARTIYHYKTASDRTQHFPLADAAVVIPQLYKETPEKKSDVSIRDYSDYNTPEADYRNGMVIDKAAGVQELDLGTPKEYADTSLDAQANQAYRIINVQRDLAKTARDEANVAATKAMQILGKVAEVLRSGYEEVAMSRYNDLMNGYSKVEQFVPVMEKLNEHLPAWLKCAYVENDAVVDDRNLEPVLTQINEARGWMEAEAEMLAVASQLEKEADDFEAEWLSMILPTFPQTKLATVADLINFDLIKKAQTEVTSKKETTDLFGNPITITHKDTSKPMFGESIGEGIGKGLSSNIAETLGGLGNAMVAPRERENKKLSERLKNVQKQIMLEELMSTDPVLSAENPENVTKAYAAIMQLAPDVASNKEVVRAVLRQAVHSVAISPYEAEAWTNLEKNIRQLSGKMPVKPPVQNAPKGGR